MRRRARSRVEEPIPGDGVVHVGLVVRRVEVFAVPAGGEVVGGEDASAAGAGGEVVEFAAAVLALEALVAEADAGFAGLGRGAYCHAEALGRVTFIVSA